MSRHAVTSTSHHMLNMLSSGALDASRDLASGDLASACAEEEWGGGVSTTSGLTLAADREAELTISSSCVVIPAAIPEPDIGMDTPALDMDMDIPGLVSMSLSRSLLLEGDDWLSWLSWL